VVESAKETTRRQALAAIELRVRVAQAELSAAEQGVIDLGGQVPISDPTELNPSDSVSQFGQRDDPYPLASGVAPEAWIDLYLAGREKPHVRGNGDESSVTIQLEVYSGRALDWFAWISMWYALVHIPSKKASEKLPILKNLLKGDLSDIVYGHGDGESGYKENIII
jgi:hypothetical protein